MNDLQEWTVFRSAYHTRSLTKTAAELGITTNVASARLLSLEKRLGRSLFYRDTRPFKPTAAAHAVIRDVEAMLNARQHIDRWFLEKNTEGSAVIRVMIGNAFRRFVTQLITQYADEHPNLRCNMISPVDTSEFLSEKADVIAVSGRTDLPNCMMLPRGRMIFVPVASPEYLQKHGPLDSPDDLKGHRVYSNLYANRYSFAVTYPLMKNGRIMTYTRQEQIRWSNVDIAREAVCNGLGIGLTMPLFACIDDLEAGRLVPILNGWHRPSQQNYLACRKDDWNISYMREFMHWFAEELTFHETSCERRFSELFGEALLAEYASNG